MYASTTILLDDGDEITASLPTDGMSPFVQISSRGAGETVTIGVVSSAEAPADTLDRLIGNLQLLRDAIVVRAGGSATFAALDGRLAAGRELPGWHRPGVAGGCPISSSITGQPCELEDGHQAWSAVRFHKYSWLARSGDMGALELRAIDGDR